MAPWAALALWAQSCTPETACEARTLPAVEARAERPPAVARPDTVDLETLRQQRRALDITEALSTLPGVVARQRYNEAQDSQISIRGFGARSPFGARGLRVEYDGIPATAVDGQSQLGHIDLAGGGQLSLIRGPFATLYGSGGAYLRIDGARRRDADQLSLGLGSNGQRRYGFALDGGDAAYWSLSGNRNEVAGERARSRNERTLLAARGDVEVGPGWLSVTAHWQDQPLAEDALGLTRAEYLADPTAASPAAEQFRTRKATRQGQVGARYQWEQGPTQWRLTAYGGQRSVEQYLAVTPQAQQSPTNGGGVVDLARDYYGWSLELERDLSLAGLPLALQARLRDEQLIEDRLGYENYQGNTLGVRGALRRDERNRGGQRDVMLRADLDLSPAWTLSAGVRRSLLDYRSSDRYVAPGNPDDSGRYDSRAWLPAFGFSYQWQPRWRLHAAAGRSVEVPTLAELAYRADGDGGFNTELKPAQARQFEFGVDGRWERLQFEGTLFRVDTEDEIVVDSASGGRSSFRNASATRREGLETALQWRPSRSLQLRAVASWIDARYTEPYAVCLQPTCTTPSLLIAAGQRMPGVPPRFGRIELDWRGEGAWSAGLEWQAFAATLANDRNRDQVPGYAVLGARLRWAPPGSQMGLLLRVDNLLDRRYSSSLIVNEAARRYYEPAPGRGFWLGLDWRL
ncbi:MAG: TonB-dependent receptor [Lysobacterales bacterium]